MGGSNTRVTKDKLDHMVNDAVKTAVVKERRRSNKRKAMIEHELSLVRVELAKRATAIPTGTTSLC